MSKDIKGIVLSIAGIGFCVALVVGLFYGYISNLVYFVKTDFEPSYKEEIVRGVGIFIPPVGVVLGYVDLEDNK